MGKTLPKTKKLTTHQPTPTDLRVAPGTLYASRQAGASLFIERLDDTPAGWLRKHGASALPHSIPVIVMLDSTENRAEWCDVISLEYGDEAPLLHIDQAIAALQMAREALVAAGQVDFIPKAAA